MTAVAVIRLGAYLGGVPAAVVASLALVLMPRFYGHAFNNPKDIPFACATAWSVFAICRLVLSGGAWRWIGGCGACLGLALAVRPAGLPVLAGLFSCALGWAWISGRESRALLRSSAVVWVLAWLLMIAVWPWAHESPLLNPLRAIGAGLSYPMTVEVLFEGANYSGTHLPRRYLAEFMTISTPLGVLGLAGAGLAVAGTRLVRELADPRTLGLVLVTVWLLAPFTIAAVTRPNVYDGMRHVLFVLPALAILAGLAAAALLQRIVDGRLRIAALAAITLLLALPIPALVRLHPYQSTYFNWLVGGVAGAQGRFETDYWVASYKEAIEWVNERADERPGRELRVLVAATDFSFPCAAAYAGPGVSLTPMFSIESGALPETFDYYVATTRYGLHQNYRKSPIAHTVGRDGAVFTVIRTSR
jgi:4-amino-4-deoxy-L-arabinose transferase-like glycosyltransferase